MDAPKYASHNAEDFLLLECDQWSDGQRAHYERENEKLENFGFFKNVKRSERPITDFG